MANYHLVNVTPTDGEKQTSVVDIELNGGKFLLDMPLGDSVVTIKSLGQDEARIARKNIEAGRAADDDGSKGYENATKAEPQPTE